MASKSKEAKKAESAGQDVDLKKVQGALYDGVVIKFDYTAELYEVDVVGTRVTCQYLTPVFSRLLGLQFKYVIPKGTRVKVVLGPSPCIVGTLPGAEPETIAEARTRHSVTGDRIREFSEADKVSPQTPGIPSDLLEGELDLTNEMHVGLQLLLGMARLTAGEKAVVETVAYNDMVRIVSEVFRHHSAFGDEEIYNDGRLNKVQHGTSYDHEAWGALDDDDSVKSAVDDDGAPTEAAGDAGRWRYSQYLGFLGDFIHMFVTDPTTTAGNMYDSAARAGKARVQIMSDGTLLAQTVSEVVIERVCRVTVPVQKQKWDSPDGDLSTQMDSLETRYVQLWKGLKSSRDRQDLADMSYQMREYARWLNTFHSFSRFLQLSKDWTVPTEASQPTPSWGNSETSVEQANESENPLYYDTYACIRIMRDGSILLWSGDGSSVTMAGGSVQVHASRNLDLRAAGDVRIHAGRDIHMHARRHMDFMALMGGIRTRARGYLESLCEKGSILLQSNAEDPNDPDYTPETGTADNPAPTVRDEAVVVRATKGKTTVHSHRHLKMITTHPAAEDSEDANITIRSNMGDIKLQAATYTRGVDVFSGFIRLRALGSLWIKAAELINTLQGFFLITNNDGTPRLANAPGGATITTRVSADIVEARQSLLSREAPEGYPVAGVVGATDQTDDPLADFGVEDEVIEWANEEKSTQEPPFDPDPVFEYPEGEYSPPDRNRETLTDQFLRKDLPSDWTDQYGTWGPTDARIQGKRGPYSPEEESTLQHNPTSGMGALGTPGASTPGDTPVEATGFDSRPTKWNYLKDA